MTTKLINQTVYKRHVLTSALLVILFSIAFFGIGYLAASPGPAIEGTTYGPGDVDPYSYVIYRDGSTYYAKNGTTRAVDYSDTNATTLIDSVIDAITAGDIYVTSGDYGDATPTVDMNITVILASGVTNLNCSLNGGQIIDHRYLEPYTRVHPSMYGIVEPHWRERLGYNAHMTFTNDGYLYLNTLEQNVGIEPYLQVLKPGLPYGVYQWEAYSPTTIESDIQIWLGFSEKWCGYGTEARIFLVGDSSSWRFTTATDSNNEQTVISDVDFTVSHTFKIDYSADAVVFYVDGVQKANHTTYIPPENGQGVIFIEGKDADNSTGVEIYTGNYAKLG